MKSVKIIGRLIVSPVVWVILSLLGCIGAVVVVKDFISSGDMFHIRDEG